jgi:hypothetical protein
MHGSRLCSRVRAVANGHHANNVQGSARNPGYAVRLLASLAMKLRLSQDHEPRPTPGLSPGCIKQGIWNWVAVRALSDGGAGGCLLTSYPHRFPRISAWPSKDNESSSRLDRKEDLVFLDESCAPLVAGLVSVRRHGDADRPWRDTWNSSRTQDNNAESETPSKSPSQGPSYSIR